MKYLKTYESYSDSLSEIIDYIKDICLDLKDDEFDIYVGDGDTYIQNNTWSEMKDLYSIQFGDIISSRLSIGINRFGGLFWSKNSRKFNISEVYDTIYTIINYMESNGYESDVKINTSIRLTAKTRRSGRPTLLTDITTEFNAARKTKDSPVNLDVIGPIRYIKIFFKKE
jgi:hypothetical protein